MCTSERSTIKFCCTLFVFFMLSASIFAISTRIANGQTQMQMNLEADKCFATADRQLNSVYNSLLAREDRSSAHQLVVAQRAWLVFRDAEAKYETCDYVGGTVYPMQYSYALASLTNDRIRQLNELQHSDGTKR